MERLVIILSPTTIATSKKISNSFHINLRREIQKLQSENE